MSKTMTKVGEYTYRLEDGTEVYIDSNDDCASFTFFNKVTEDNEDMHFGYIEVSFDDMEFTKNQIERMHKIGLDDGYISDFGELVYNLRYFGED